MGAEEDAIYEILAQTRRQARRNNKMENITGYRRIERILHGFDGYDLAFRQYERNNWKGGAARISERGF
jgi:S-adenosylmethionine decarboxylase